MSLSDYQNDLQWLIHDNNYLFSTKAQQTRWINQSRRECARRTGCVMRLISGQSAFGASAQPGSMIPGAVQPGALPGAFPNAQTSSPLNAFQTIQGSERMPFVGFANPFLKAQHAGVDEIIDVASIAVSWGGSIKPTLNWLPWEDLQAYARVYNNLIENFVFWWSVYNPGTQGEVWMYPVPSIPMAMDWNVYATPADLHTDDDFDAIPDGMKTAIKYGAAKLSFLTSQRYGQAQIYEDLFAQSMGVTSVAVDRGKVPSFY